MSLTVTGLLSALLGYLLTPEEASEVIKFIEQAVVVGSIVAAYWGRYRIGDITWYGARK